MPGLDVIKFTVPFEGILSYSKRFIAINLKSATSMAIVAFVLVTSIEELSIKL
jgi:hypothetical protein